MIHRTIKSYVVRAGRISNRQQLALDEWLKNFQLPINKTPWNLTEIFNRQAKTVVEIGFGMGSSLLAMAEAAPECNFIGIEVHQAGVGSLVADLQERNITNVRVVMGDAVDVFKDQLLDNSIDGVQVFFPDPWHKKRHNKRRLIQTELVALLSAKIRTGGFVHCATDWQDYAEHMLLVLENEPQLLNKAEGNHFFPRPAHRPSTKFEQRGERLGHGVWDLMFIKV